MKSRHPHHHSFRLNLVLVPALIGILISASAYAQIGGAANIAGVITDDSGGALPGVTVTITNTATGRAQTLVTSDEGRYRAVALQPGPYEVSAELQGFATVRRGITLVVGSEANLDLRLGVANLAETITVVGGAPLVEVAKSQPSSVITGEQLQALPVLSRSFMVLAQLLPGSAPISTTPGLPRNGATKFGAVPDQRYAYITLIDGGEIDDPFWGHPIANLGQDAVAEFKVYRNQFDAQYGGATTAVVTVVTKSGTNRMSGTGYYFGRDKALNGTNAFATGKPPFTQARLGYSFGGPVVQNQTHYFSAYEGLFVNTAQLTALPANNPFASMENGTYPTKQRNRNFAARVDHRFNDAHNMYVRYTYDFQGDYAFEKPLRILDGGLLTLGEQDLNSFNKSYSAVAEENWILSGTKVNTLRGHFFKQRLWATATFTGLAVARPSYSWGQQQQSPQQFPQTQFTLSDSFLITKGKHDLNIGGGWNKGQFAFDAHHAENGLWTFLTDAPFNQDDPKTYPFQFVIRNKGYYTRNDTQIAAYISDTYRVHPRWTLNLGLRWDLSTNLRDNEIIYRMLDDPQFKGIENFVHRNRGNQYDAFQPRLGATWDIRGDGTLVGRGGWGVYDVRDRQWYSVNQQQVNYGYTAFISDQAHMKCYPSVSCVLDGKSLSAFVAGSGLRSLQLINDNYRLPYQRTATAGIGWQLTRTTSLDVDAVHSHMPNAMGAFDANLPASGPVSASNPRPVPTLGRVAIQNLPNTKSWYDAMEMQLRQRVRGANSLQVSYTLSRALMDGVGRELVLRSLQRTPYEFGYNPLDSRHNFVVSASFALPLGFQLSGIGRVISSFPLSVTCNCDLDGDGVVDRPPGLQITVGRGDLQRQLDIINAYRASVNLAPFTIDRLKVKAPPKNIDVRLTKRMNLGQARSMELFLEAYNITNFVNVTGSNGNIRLATFNVPTGAQDARQIQWGARYVF